MKTNKPEIVAYMSPAHGEVVPQQDYADWERAALREPDSRYGAHCKSETLEYSEPLIRLSDYETLQARTERLAEALELISDTDPDAETAGLHDKALAAHREGGGV